MVMALLSFMIAKPRMKRGKAGRRQSRKKRRNVKGKGKERKGKIKVYSTGDDPELGLGY